MRVRFSVSDLKIFHTYVYGRLGVSAVGVCRRLRCWALVKRMNETTKNGPR